jgi:hypothetical protein
MASASSTSIPRYRTVLSSFVWPSSSCTALQIAGLLVNLCRLRSAQRVRTICRAIEPGAVRPSMGDAGVLPRRQVRLSTQTAWEQISALASVDGGEPLADSNMGLFGDFELNRSACLLLNYRRSIANPPARANVVGLEPNEVAALQLAVNGQIEHREITFAVLQLEPHPDRSHVLRLQRALLTDQTSLVPRLAASGGIFGFPWGWSPPMPAPSTPAPLDLDRLGEAILVSAVPPIPALPVLGPERAVSTQSGPR